MERCRLLNLSTNAPWTVRQHHVQAMVQVMAMSNRNNPTSLLQVSKDNHYHYLDIGLHIIVHTHAVLPNQEANCCDIIDRSKLFRHLSHPALLNNISHTYNLYSHKASVHMDV